MLWSERNTLAFGRRAAIFALLAVGATACGFTPVYGPDGGGRALINSVLVEQPKGSDEFTLAQELENRFGPSTTPTYSLTFKLETESDSISITQTQETNRYNTIGSAEYTLTNRASGAVVQSGEVDGFTSYSSTGTTVATAAAEQDSYDRLMVVLADKIVNELVTLPIQTPQTPGSP